MWFCLWLWSATDFIKWPWPSGYGIRLGIWESGFEPLHLQAIFNTGLPKTANIPSLISVVFNVLFVYHTLKDLKNLDYEIYYNFFKNSSSLFNFIFFAFLHNLKNFKLFSNRKTTGGMDLYGNYWTFFTFLCFQKCVWKFFRSNDYLKTPRILLFHWSLNNNHNVITI